MQGGECDQLSGDKPSIIITGKTEINWNMIISIICTGHEDGKVKLWLSQKNSLSLLTCLDTARYFTTDEIRFVENFYEEKFLCIFS